MKQIFIEYHKWEDYLAGMYNDNDIIDKDIKINNSVLLLSNPFDFYSVCRLVINNWVNSVDVNLSNKNQNRRAWLGAAACMYNHKSPEYITRIAWGILDLKKQAAANNVAEKIILEYERKNTGIHIRVGEPLLF
jgi:hypothetical protein